MEETDRIYNRRCKDARLLDQLHRRSKRHEGLMQSAHYF